MTDNNESISCISRETSLTNHLEKLVKEFDCIGLPTINVHVDIIDQLISSIYRLIAMYRKGLSVQKDIAIKEQVLRKENRNYQAAIQNFNELIVEKDNAIRFLNEKLHSKDIEIDVHKKEISILNRTLDTMSDLCKSKEMEFSHKYKIAQNECKDLQNQLADHIGKFHSKNSAYAELVARYKTKENVYEDTIKKLQSNNEQLMQEILNLKEEVLVMLYNDDERGNKLEKI